MSMDLAESMMEPADFIDPGADDGESVKGIKQGHVRDWADLIDSIKQVETENWQLKQALGYPVPADKDTPNNPFKCGVCDARNTTSAIDRYHLADLLLCHGEFGATEAASKEGALRCADAVLGAVAPTASLATLVEAYIQNLPWTTAATEHEKALVIGNLRNFARRAAPTQ